MKLLLMDYTPLRNDERKPFGYRFRLQETCLISLSMHSAGLSLSFVIRTMLDTYLVIKSAVLDSDELIKVEKEIHIIDLVH